jgi:hypothetical protein
MTLLEEKNEIMRIFESFNSALIKVFDPHGIEAKSRKIRSTYVNNQLTELFTNFSFDILKYNSNEQIVTEITNSKMRIHNEIILKYEKRPLKHSTKKAIDSGTNYILIELDNLKLIFEEKIINNKLEKKQKYEDVRVSEKEYALFIILAQKYGLISKIPSAKEKSLAFSSLTNISNQSLQDNIGSKYQLIPNELLLKKDNLNILKQTLENICAEIELIRNNLTA